MNFLRNKNFRQLGAYVGVLAVLVFVVEYFLLGWKISKLEEAELKQEYTRIAQVANQQISMDVQDFLNGNSRIASEIASQLGEQDHRLSTLASGGRVEQRDEFVHPLSRLPRITFMAMREDWELYKQSVSSIILAVPEQPAPTPQPQEPDSSAVAEATPLLTSTASAAQPTLVQYHGLSISMNKWYERLMTDLHEEVQNEQRGVENLRVLITAINIAAVFALFFLLNRFILKPLDALKVSVAEHKHSDYSLKNEIGSVAENINHTIEQLRDAADFVMTIGKGDLTVNYREAFDKNYVRGQNRLADSLIDMQAKLQQLNEEEQKRQWANEGLAKFVDILRSTNDNMHVLGDKIVSGLVQYLRANQGALYLLNDETQSNQFLELISLFAFDTKKFEQQHIKPGQGILGQTFLERETTHLTALPEEYVRITSGLGGATPRSILIVPLKVDQDVYGLVELASFREFEPHEIAFVEKLGESIASTLASVRGVQRNKILIEQFTLQAEQMKAQEEEMRQNMEELQATQEEVVRKERNYIARIEELERMLSERPEQADQGAALAFAEKEQAYRHKLEQLEKDLAEAVRKGEDWDIASDLVKMLRFNLEALKVSEQEARSRA